ncbi:hypothetical protein BOTBODRAFT_506040 [Botryobasidium botryosum FD-172 SS1]|uniref:Uncharacterized protein n=1 Tax=Botryobasidium botryosum (strain FD-172 SS1) TaxID=930990 RepID=A0A067M2X8_BOTB1|nr:hypothetical protein BOTBODRAFT_506040 [Botryobasidium botryosum FD-172 SS1]
MNPSVRVLRLPGSLLSLFSLRARLHDKPLYALYKLSSPLLLPALPPTRCWGHSLRSSPLGLLFPRTPSLLYALLSRFNRHAVCAVLLSGPGALPFLHTQVLTRTHQYRQCLNNPTSIAVDHDRRRSWC